MVNEPGQGLLQHLVHLQPAGRVHPDALRPGTSPRPGAKAGSGGCTTDTARGQVGQVRRGLQTSSPRRPKARQQATRPARSGPVVDGPWKIPSSYNTNGNVTMVPNPSYSGRAEAEPDRRSSTVVHQQLDHLHRAQDRSARHRPHPCRRTCLQKPAELDSCRRPTRSAAAITCRRSTRTASTTSPPNTEHAHHRLPIFKQLYVRQALQFMVHGPARGQPTAICRGYAVRQGGAAPACPPNQWDARQSRAKRHTRGRTCSAPRTPSRC